MQFLKITFMKYNIYEKFPLLKYYIFDINYRN